MDPDLESPDHTTLSRCAEHLEIKLPAVGKGSSIQLVVDSTGLQIVGQGPWARAKNGQKGDSRVAEAECRGRSERSDRGRGAHRQHHGRRERRTRSCKTGSDDTKIMRRTADGAYDQSFVYETFVELGATVVVPPVKSASLSRRKMRVARARNRTVRRVRKVGRRQWKKETRYHRQARVENTFFRFKQLFGGRLRSRHRGNHATEAGLACNILNRVLQLGAPRSEPIRD